MNTRPSRAMEPSGRRTHVGVSAGAALLLGALTVACGDSGASNPGSGTAATGEDAGVSTPTSGGDGTSDAASPPVMPGDAGSVADTGAATPLPDAGPAAPDAASTDAAPIEACGSTSSISSILSQYGSGSTASTITPMGTRFEAAAQAGPISAANATFLATASSNPDVSDATSATGLSWQTVSVELYPSGAPSPEDIMQHDIGDCDGDSALASMAYVNPYLVQSVIKDNGDGTYTIAMFDPTGAPITVTVDSEFLVETGSTNLGQISASNGSADWATVLEKAVMKYDYAYGMVGQIDGIGSETLVPMFTGAGDSVAISPGSLTPAQFQQVVTVSLAAGDFITGGFNQVLTIGQDQTVTAHGYAVMIPSDPSTDMTDMRNPWGINPWADTSTSGYDTSTDGLLQIPLATTPTNWPTIIDLRLIDPPTANCTGVTTPFVPQFKKAMAPIRIREPHARGAH